ncbi:hypothetical protein LPB86_01405 [Pedobacter sp. MC2016-14]|uniref:hypothetical protein n=1 Tax=Pedobacter sp. MC2016-14 TaxID=2897327 RepID=UPI001E375E84|nr:hypothetical protein [Pedobacter sp. MC2016-14]MCD0486865.1 hypothetical protein [Pedobacter sp. MC2016-14]
MKNVICTLFEGSYDLGVVALVNSLYKNGFRGEFYAGYRGNMPKWANSAQLNKEIQWAGCKSMNVAEGIILHFLPVATNYHLTNYKPDFMLDLLNGPAKDADGMFYFDPDIVVTAPWSFLSRWINCGVALCEDVNSPLKKNHPTRVAWREYFSGFRIDLSFKDSVYVNGGFVGVKIKDKGFLETWKNVQEAMAAAIGGLERSAFTTGSQLPEESQGPFAPFGKTDQDALNAAVEAWDGEFSFITKEGMGFGPGLRLLPHALGQPKPWNAKYIKRAFSGRTPRDVDKEYWKYIDNPLSVYPSSMVRSKNMAINVATLISRFYKR